MKHMVMQTQVLKFQIPTVLGYSRVATHSGNSRKFDSFFLTQGNSWQFWFFSKNFREVLRFFKKSQGTFFLDLERDLVNPVLILYFVLKS